MCGRSVRNWKKRRRGWWRWNWDVKWLRRNVRVKKIFELGSKFRRELLLWDREAKFVCNGIKGKERVPGEQ